MTNEAIPILHVEDAAVAVNWYEHLGYATEWEHRFEPTFPAFVSVARGGGARLFLSEHRGDARPDTLVYLRVPDVDQVAEEFGAEIVEQPWGREIHLTDPDGTVFESVRRAHEDHASNTRRDALYVRDMVSRRTAPWAAAVAVVATALVWLAALVVPVYSSSTSFSGSTPTGTSVRATLVEVNDLRVLVVLAIPIAITTIGLLAVRARLPRSALSVACALMWMWTILTGFSVGLFYLPADAALIVALAATPPRRRVSGKRLSA